MSGFTVALRPILMDAAGRPVGVMGADGQEYFFPRYSDDMSSLIKPSGEALAGQGAGFVLQPATSTVLGGVKQGPGISIDANGVISVIVGSPTAQLVADEALPARSLVYIKPNGRLALADAVGEGKEPVGYVNAIVASGGAGTVSFSGSIINGFSGLTPGAPYFLSLTPGGITSTAPSTVGNLLMQVGIAIGTTSLLFAPQLPITL